VEQILGTRAAMRTAYRDAFERTLHIDPHMATIDELAASATSARVPIPSGMRDLDRDEWLNLLLASCIEPRLGQGAPEILYHYPASQASLATTIRTETGCEVAERFELYYQGIELANGFHELGDGKELRDRFDHVNAARAVNGRDLLPIPASLLAALEHGL